MAIIKCKMCGGNLLINTNESIAICDSCGTQQTIPVVDNEKKMNLFNRANRLRMNSEFDRAATIYASITAEFPEEAEAYWGLCLCKYGIEYVDDPATGNKIPTCHRTLTESIMDDIDFVQAYENADSVAKKTYREEAKAIDHIQQSILAIVAKEPPYDVFICYKETAEDGTRTEDSVLAQDIYDALTGKGLKVFFSRITLEDKLGQQYEPYIYAALHSSRVMLAVGTQFEYYDAVWVKNEWARFLDMMRNNKEKALVPCYKGLDAYDMPREFRNLQAQDMSKLGWLQDLTRGVVKLCGKAERNSEKSANDVQKDSDPVIAGLLRRAEDFLENRSWNEATQYAERILDVDIENAQAYLIKLLASRKVSSINDLELSTVPISETLEYKRIIKYADYDLKEQLQKCSNEIDDKYLLVYRKHKIGVQLLQMAQTVAEFAIVKGIFEETAEFFSEAAQGIKECEKRIKSISSTILSDNSNNLVAEIELFEFSVSANGYDQRSVDEFLDNVCDKLCEIIENQIEINPTIRMVSEAQFPVVKYGYNAFEVDRFLDSICSRLSESSGSNRTSISPEFSEAQKEIDQINAEEKKRKKEKAEKDRAEKEKRKAEYWTVHVEEKKELDGRKESILTQQAEITAAYNSRVSELCQEMDALEKNDQLKSARDQVSMLEEKFSKLSIFKIKEKKLVQEHLEQATNMLYAIQDRITKQKRDLEFMLDAARQDKEKSLAVLQYSLRDIEEELN